jgi:acyl-CoA hydrolase
LSVHSKEALRELDPQANEQSGAREATLRFLAEPSEVNFGGNVHGGTVMKWIDHAGYTCAVGWSGRYCVTVYVGGIQFQHPIHIGDLVEVRAKVIYTGKTSVHICVEVWAGDPRDRELRRTTHCVIVFVSVDRDRNPVPVAPWVPVMPADLALQDYALQLTEQRKLLDGKHPLNGAAAKM